MSRTYYGGIRRSGGSWTEEEMQLARTMEHNMNKERVKKMKKEGFDIKLVSVPPPSSDEKMMKKYARDKQVKEFLKPNQTINPYGLRKPIVD